MQRTLGRLLFGDPLRSSQEMEHRLTRTKALAVFSSDALSSVAYATEEILRVLVLAGIGALSFSTPIAIVIVVLLAIVAASYYQTIHGYPSGGGAFIVAADNLGEYPGLVAAAALLVDYVLTVAVSVTAGVEAIHSAFPELHGHRVLIATVMIILIAWANVRGVRESGTLFAMPTYSFVVLVLTLIGCGIYRIQSGLVPVAAPHHAVPISEPLGILLLLRAFSSGCTAMTGVEAISNGIPAFQPPESRNAGQTLIAMACLLGTMFVGITFLAKYFHVVPHDQESVLSQISRHVFGEGIFYYALQFSTTLILVLAANTSFADFPRLASILARKGYVPRQLANLGDRLVYANGIFMLAILAALLVAIFDGRTYLLIPLYAVGVFLSFTLSQCGMVRHWYVVRLGRWQIKAFINGLGAIATGIVLLVIIESKFSHGAWIVVVLIPVVVWMFKRIEAYYRWARARMALDHGNVTIPPGADRSDYKVVVPVAAWNKATLGALRFARALSKDVIAVMVDVDPEKTKEVDARWKAAAPEIPFIVLPSPYRSVVEPFVDFLRHVDRRDPEKGLAIVVVPQPVPARWWQNLFHNQTAFFLKANLMYRRERSMADRIIVDVPYHLGR
ncbi:MAG: APC family permease [Planctomycetota bacterium]